MDKYNEECQIYYNYKFKNILNDLNTLNTYDYKNFYICVYKVNTSGKYPFLQYLFLNNGFYLTIPKLPIYETFENNNLLSYSKVYLSGLLDVDFNKVNEFIKFNGCNINNLDLYLFFDITELNIDINDIYSSSNLKFLIIDEIINYNSSCNIPINKETIKYFLNTELILYLFDENQEIFEIPIVGYVPKENENKLKFTYLFGETAGTKLDLMGPYYYFTNLTNSIKKYVKKGGIVRFAIFTGKTKYVENLPNDKIDLSIIKNELIKNEENNKKHILTLRISDHDGLWSKEYDSVFIGEIELDDGSFLENTPILVLKDYKQQIPLSYHFTNKVGII